MRFAPDKCLFLFVDVQRGFVGADGQGRLPRLQAFHAELTGNNLPVWHVHMRDRVHPERQASVNRMQEPLVMPQPGQRVFTKTTPAPDQDEKFAAALQDLRPEAVVACRYYFDCCVSATVSHAGNVMAALNVGCDLAIVDDLCAPGYYKDRATRGRWLVHRQPSGIRLIDRADLELAPDSVTLPDPLPQPVRQASVMGQAARPAVR